MNVEAKREREITAVVGKFENVLTQLTTTAHDLGAQLVSVLSPETEGKSVGKREQGRSPMGNTLNIYADQISDITDYLRDLIGRLEV